jgi:hypothetical protein
VPQLQTVALRHHEAIQLRGEATACAREIDLRQQEVNRGVASKSVAHSVEVRSQTEGLTKCRCQKL